MFIRLGPRTKENKKQKGIGPIIRIARESQCLPYAGFFKDGLFHIPTSHIFLLLAPAPAPDPTLTPVPGPAPAPEPAFTSAFAHALDPNPTPDLAPAAVSDPTP